MPRLSGGPGTPPDQETIVKFRKCDVLLKIKVSRSEILQCYAKRIIILETRIYCSVAASIKLDYSRYLSHDQVI